MGSRGPGWQGSQPKGLTSAAGLTVVLAAALMTALEAALEAALAMVLLGKTSVGAVP